MKVISIIVFGFLFVLSLCAWAEASKIGEKTVELDYTCKPGGYEVLKRLIGECAGKDFESPRSVDVYNKSLRTAYVITNWEDFRRFRKDVFQAPFFEKEISQQFFEEYSLGVVFAITAGAGFLKNEKLSVRNGKCIFTYEFWEHKDVAPACVWESLYVLKIKK